MHPVDIRISRSATCRNINRLMKEKGCGVHDLQEAYLPIIESAELKAEYHALLKDYVGRPSPLYYAKRMSEQYGCQLYLKREDLNHTGEIGRAHV